MLYLITVLFLLIGGALTLVTIQNLSPSVHLMFFSWQMPDFPLGLWLLAFFLLGAIVFYAIGVLSALGERAELKRLKKRIKELEPPAVPNVLPLQAQITAPLTTSGPLTVSGPLPAPEQGAWIPMPGVPASNGGVPRLPTPDAPQ